MLPPILADMNIAVPVVDFLRKMGIDIISAREKGWNFWSDSELLAKAFAEKRYVLTHGSDFGMLAIFRREPVWGIIFLRPGGNPPNTVIEDLKYLIDFEIEWKPKTIAIYKNGRLRLRSL